MHLGMVFMAGLAVASMPATFEPPQKIDVVTKTDSQGGRTSSRYVGSAMALLATFDDAGILPPEGTPEANRIIKAVIQFQSAFLKSHHPAVRAFFSDAHRARFGDRAPEVEAVFERTGWSAESYEAVMEAGLAERAWEANGLKEGLQEFNLGKPDFDVLANLYQRSRQVFSGRGTSFSDVFGGRRRDMPGAR